MRPGMGERGKRRPAAFAAAAALVMAAAPLGCDRIAGPQAMVASALTESAGEGRVLEVPGCGALTIRRAVFSRLLVKPEGNGMVAVATVDAEAEVGGEGTLVSYLGLERVPFACDSVRCAPVNSPLPSLVSLLSAVCGRRGARGSEEGRADDEKVSRWIIRVDRAQAEVLEERAGRRERFVLKNENGTFSFAPGVY
jgi:hypothetical protein